MNITRPKPNIQIRKAISVNLSAAQWNLEVEKFPRLVIEKVADFLNKRITMDFNRGESRDYITNSFQGLVADFEIYGATNPKTYSKFNEVMDVVTAETTFKNGRNSTQSQ